MIGRAKHMKRRKRIKKRQENKRNMKNRSMMILTKMTIRVKGKKRKIEITMNIITMKEAMQDS